MEFYRDVAATRGGGRVLVLLLRIFEISMSTGCCITDDTYKNS